MSSINQLRNNRDKYKIRLNTAKNKLKIRINTLKREGKSSNNMKSNNAIRQYLKHHKHYKNLVQQYGELITQKEKAEFEQLERDANNAVQKINEPNNISDALKQELNQFAVHKKYVDRVSNILAGKGTRKRKNRRPRRNRVTQNANKQNTNNSCQQRSINGACILGGIGAGAAIGGIPGACVGGVCGAAAAVGRRFMGGKTRKRKRNRKKGTRKKYKR
jgi:hypothetical protein